MKSRDSASYQVGIVGTFDVENYGDLLFPIIAERQLSRRLNNVKLLPFSPNAASRDQAWPLDVFASATLNAQLPMLSALLIGGGQIIRFDKGYPIAVAENVNLPLDYWLMPAVLAAVLGKPVIWNAPGALTGSAIPACYANVLKATLSASAWIGLRDEASRTHLRQLEASVPIERLPDTAFSLATLWPNNVSSAAYQDWCKQSDLDQPYVVLQADQNIVARLPEIIALLSRLQVKSVVLLPVCKCHGDDSQHFPATLPFHVVRSGWLDPLLICEVISHSDLIIASSLHASITAVNYGIPCIRMDSFNHYDRKFEIVNAFGNVCRLHEIDRIVALYQQVRVVDPRAVEDAHLLEQYWDRVVEVMTNWGPAEAQNATAKMLPVIAEWLKKQDDRRPEGVLAARIRRLISKIRHYWD